MSKNLIPVIAKELGVENGEEFEIKGITSSKYRIKNDKLEVNFWDDKWEPSTLSISLLGNIEIIKLPYKPVLHEEYWTYDRNWNFVTVAWSNDFFDYIALKNGCVFRTYDEVHDARMSKYEELTGQKWSEENG